MTIVTRGGTPPSEAMPAEMSSLPGQYVRACSAPAAAACCCKLPACNREGQQGVLHRHPVHPHACLK